MRLPKDTFPDTEVVTDIIYLRKREPGDARPVDRSWVDTAMVELPTDYEPEHRYSSRLVGIKPQEYSVNQYFLNNPDKVLGIQDGTGTMRGPNQYNVRTPSEALTRWPSESGGCHRRHWGGKPRPSCGLGKSAPTPPSK